MSSPLLLAQISDCHLYADKDKAGYADIVPYDTLQQVLRLLAEHRPDALLISGDLSGDHSRQSYLHLRHLLQTEINSLPVHMIAGNHDDRALMQATFEEQQLLDLAPATYGGWQLHGLNSQAKGTLGYVSQQQLEQLTDRVNRHADLHHIVAVHHHPIAVDGWMDKHQWTNRQIFLKHIDTLPEVKAVLYGHIHRDVHHRRQECQYWACPSTCWQWGDGAEFGLSTQQPGFRLLRCFDNGEIASQVYRLAD
ncbi:metallophosphoesterase family protein [Neptunicella sp. SCSIO 80796]|uniref:metallophosphoesterase family protein n=1 Tax=Neptunicella plasticusilytica TaxID=3117012 RepID=UPI003A4D449D